MKARLPENTELAHRTGIYGTNDENLRVALNDLGIAKLPNGKHFILSVCLKNITKKNEDTEKIIADITKTVCDYYVKKNIVVSNPDHADISLRFRTLMVTDSYYPFDGYAK